MSGRAVFNVATGSHYCLGQQRLLAALQQHGCGAQVLAWTNVMPPDSPSHQQNPYAFKAYALQHALTNRARPTTLLWADASILPIRSMEPLWERIERDGYWISNNGWTNDQWMCDAAYPHLFPTPIDDEPGAEEWTTKYAEMPMHERNLLVARRFNRKIQHVVATTFGISLDHPIGREFLSEYVRLADAGAFRGPWWNSNASRKDYASNFGAEPCGPPECFGHRHDQTAASVIAWRLGMKLTDAPEIFCYSKRRPDGTLHLEDQDERTILLADGAFQSGVYGG